MPQINKKKLNNFLLIGLMIISLLITPFGSVSATMEPNLDAVQTTGDPKTDIVQPTIDSNLSQYLEQLNDIVKKLYVNYVGELDLEELFKKLTDTVIKSLNDRHTNFLDQDSYEQLIEDIDQEFVGVGIEIIQTEGIVTVIRPIYNSPAYLAGIIAGDIIIAVDDQDIFGIDINDIVDMIKGPLASQVELTVQRDQETIKFLLARQLIEMSTVEGQVIENLAYIKIKTFGDHTLDHFNHIMDQLSQELAVNQSELSGIILDVRDNTGGRLDTVLDIADIFLDNKLIVAIIDKDKRINFYNAKPGGIDLPLTILVNGNSASASEILAGALQDHQRATVIGQTTYGKGTVQDLIPIEGGGYIKVTVAEYRTPKNHNIDGIGISPDYKLDYPLAQTIYAIRSLRPDLDTKLSFYLDSDYVSAYGQDYYIGDHIFTVGTEGYLPYRFIVECLGGVTTWDSQTRAIKSVINGREINLTKIELEYPLISSNNRTYVSLTDLGLIFDIDYQWENVNELDITISK